jgi:hypothetical protein
MVFFKGTAGALAASVTAVFMNGVPLLYSGQEVGRTNTLPFFSRSPINWNDNPDMLNAYKQMMAVYGNTEAARKGTTTDYSRNDIVCFKKTLNSAEVLVIVNVRNSVITYNVPVALQNISWVNTLTDSSTTLGTSLQLSNYQYLILKN